MNIVSDWNPLLGSLNAKIRQVTSKDFDQIYQLQLFYPMDLGYSKEGLKDVLSDRQSTSLVTEIKKAGNIINYILTYPAWHYKKNQKHMKWDLNEECKELEDKEALYLEAVETAPDYQRRGLYKVARQVLEITAYKSKFKRIYLHSSPNALNAHKKLGSQVVKVIPKYWKVGGEEPTDACLMVTQLTKKRACDSLDDLLNIKKENYLTIDDSNKPKNEEIKEVCLQNAKDN
ncbi:MAG: GNAT family N-acetyltransferase [archaeon]